MSELENHQPIDQNEEEVEDPFVPLEMELDSIANDFFQCAEAEDYKALKKVIKRLTEYKKSVNRLQTMLKNLVALPTSEVPDPIDKYSGGLDTVIDEEVPENHVDGLDTIVPEPEPVKKRRGRPKA